MTSQSTGSFSPESCQKRKLERNGSKAVPNMFRASLLLYELLTRRTCHCRDRVVVVSVLVMVVKDVVVEVLEVTGNSSMVVIKVTGGNFVVAGRRKASRRERK